MSKRKSQYVFGSVPSIHHSRSKFDLSFSHKTTLNLGDLCPLYCQEVYPGDTFKCDAHVVARVTSSFLKPVMDNLFCDVMFFFVPSRTIFDNWAEIFGENNQSAWARETVVNAPLITSSSDYDVEPRSIASYLGLPIGLQSDQIVSAGGVSILPFRAYAKIYNEWYRDENLIDPMNIQTGDWNSETELLRRVSDGVPFGPDNYTGVVAKVAKLHDYFTQCLPAPQKGDPVTAFSGVVPAINAPVTTGVVNSDLASPAMSFRVAGSNTIPSSGHLGVGVNGFLGSDSSNPFTLTDALTPANLHALIPQTDLGSVDVNDLRFAFQLQKMLERDAIFGTRYTEYIQGHFGVTSPDARLQRSEFLGGRRFPLNVLQTVQTSESTSSSPLGNVAGWSLSNGRSGYTKGFTEHGFVIGMFCVRQFHTYQQGVEKFWWRSKRTDFLDPLFTNIGFQPVYMKELYAGTGLVEPDDVFGYAPAFEDLRSRFNRVSGQLATAASEGLDIWHFADYYATQPVLGQEFIQETNVYLDRALSVPSDTVDNFIFDVYFKQYAIRVMPTYGMPGLVDHH